MVTNKTVDTDFDTGIDRDPSEERQVVERNDRVMDALGNQTRRTILLLLRETPRPVGEIAKLLPISRPAVSKHLHILEEAGLVQYSSEGTRNIFRLNPNGFATAHAYIDNFWQEALSNFQRLANAAADQANEQTKQTLSE